MVGRKETWTGKRERIFGDGKKQAIRKTSKRKMKVPFVILGRAHRQMGVRSSPRAGLAREGWGDCGWSQR